MLSSSADMAEFLAKVKHKPYFDIIQLADQEATEAERLILKAKSHPGSKTHVYRQYAMVLKDLLLYIRHDIKTSAVRDLDLKDFRGIRNKRNLRTPSPGTTPISCIEQDSDF